MKLTFKWDAKKREACVHADDARDIANELGSDDAIAFLAECQRMLTRFQTHALESRAKIDEIIMRRSPAGRDGQPFL